MISPRSVFQFLAVVIVDLIAWPVNKAIDNIDWDFFDSEEGE